MERVFWDSGDDMNSIKVEIWSSLSSEAALTTRKFNPSSPLKLVSPSSATGRSKISACSGLTLDTSQSDRSPYTNG
jgi:hypothetical protein